LPRTSITARIAPQERKATRRSKAYEARFDRIAEIYQDFGELDGWHDDGLRGTRWQEWFEPRRHLFMASAAVISDPSSFVCRAGHLLLDIPLQADAASTVNLVGRLMTDYYANHEVVAQPPSKYALHLKNGRPAHGFEQVRQACVSAARSYRYDPVTFEERRHVDAIADFMRNEIDNLGWKLDPKARKELTETGTLSEQRLDTFKAMLNRCRRDFMAFSRNTVRGRFPDASPFESEVLDRF
jgi:hypothetical protein